MRLNTMHEAEKNFAAWQLQMGRGGHTDPSDFITLPDHCKCAENTVQSLIDTIYPNIRIQQPDQYFSERTILCSKMMWMMSIEQFWINSLENQKCITAQTM